MKSPTEVQNEKIIRAVYQTAEAKDVPRFVSLFTNDGVFYDVSAGKKYQGKDLGLTVEIYAKAFPDMADDEWRAMACVEASNIRAFAVELAPGEQHTMKTSIRVA